MTTPRVLLISLRDAHDPMASHERACFARAADVPVDAVDVHVVFDAPLPPASVHAYDAFFFGGSGAYSVLDDTPWMPDALEALLRVIDAARPTWASCFGFQAVAKALGGVVVHDEALTEMGAVQLTLTDAGRADPLLGTLPEPFWVQEGHHDHVIALPPAVTRLAIGDRGVEQAFRIDGVPFYASQFHPELDIDAVIARFLHYADHYHNGDHADFEAILARLRGGGDTPEVARMLARLVRGEA
ncbi:MAG: type 1 glutamine amidotransferase [Alphaproteobacteria bacterium]|nr:type 1 glutamine amidotransferase [Alphaproteobacteria bacterium]